MQELVREKGYAFPVLLDAGDIGSAYRVRYVPTLFLIDAEGRIAERIVGAVDFDRLVSLVDDLTG
jgi:thioredoxin-related protein